MGRWGSFVSPRRAAKIIGVSHTLVARWCSAAERGEPMAISHIKREANGYILIPYEVVLAIRNDRADR